MKTYVKDSNIFDNEHEIKHKNNIQIEKYSYTNSEFTVLTKYM